MSETGPVLLALLAAGGSRRFGNQDKLAASLNGEYLGMVAARTLSGIGLDQRHVIAASAEHPCATGWRELGWTITVNKAAESGMGTSVALAARLAQEAGAAGLMVALADMPQVSAEHSQCLLKRFDEAGPAAIIASSDGTSRSPPAIFGPDHFLALSKLSEDKGARALLEQAETISAGPGELADIDRPEDLARYQRD